MRRGFLPARARAVLPCLAMAHAPLGWVLEQIVRRCMRRPGPSIAVAGPQHIHPAPSHLVAAADPQQTHPPSPFSPGSAGHPCLPAAPPPARRSPARRPRRSWPPCGGGCPARPAWPCGGQARAAVRSARCRCAGRHRHVPRAVHPQAGRGQHPRSGPWTARRSSSSMW